MTPAEAEALVPLAAELIATVRDYGPADVAAVLDIPPAYSEHIGAQMLAAMTNEEAAA